MSRHRSKRSLANGFVKPDEQWWACSGIVMARNGRIKSNGWFRCIDNHTACISYQGLSLLQMRVWSQIAPLLKIFLQKEWVSQILLLPSPCLSGLIHILICNTKIGEKSDRAKSWATKSSCLWQAAKPSSSGFCHVRFFTYLSVANQNMYQTRQTWQR